MPVVCVYCTEEKRETGFTRIEHVIPQSFGLFKSNLTLRGIVCDDCNQFFGNQLEIALARDTYEGASRFLYGIKKQGEFRPFGRQSRIVLRIAEGDFKGAYAFREYDPEVDKIVLRPLPQIAFRNKAHGEHDYYLRDDIPSANELKDLDVSHAQGIRSIGIPEKELVAILRNKGIEFKHGGEIIPPDKEETILAELEGVIDSTIFRAVAKIAFNYLAYWQGRDFVLESSFDGMRNFIRKGSKPAYKVVEVAAEAILEDEKGAKQGRLGHLVTVNWASDAVSMVAQVSLFNWATYKISLARNYKGKKRDIRKGSFFNVANGKILELGVR